MSQQCPLTVGYLNQVLKRVEMPYVLDSPPPWFYFICIFFITCFTSSSPYLLLFSITLVGEAKSPVPQSGCGPCPLPCVFLFLAAGGGLEVQAASDPGVLGASSVLCQGDVISGCPTSAAHYDPFLIIVYLKVLTSPPQLPVTA